MNTLRAVGFCAMLMLGLGTQAMADCFDYRSDVHSAWETIGSLKEKGTEEVRGRITEDTPQVRKRVWVGKTDFIAVQFSGNFEPVMVVTQPEEGTPLTQGWMKDDENGNKIAEMHYAGRLGHKTGDGWVDVVIQARDPGAEGRFGIWIVSIVAEKMECDPKYLPFQGGFDCQACGQASVPVRPDCGGTICKADECCQLIFGVVANCLKAQADSNGMCLP